MNEKLIVRNNTRLKDLESRLEEAEQLIEAIKAGEVDAFAIKRDSNKAEIYTLQSSDFAFRVLIEECGEGALNVTEEGLIVYTNPYFSDLIKLPEERIIGTSIFDFIDPESKQAFSALFDGAHTHKTKGEVNLLVNNTIIPVYISLTSLQPKLSTVGIIISDLTERKNNEKLIQAYQRNLESKNVKLGKMNSELQSYAHISSHDLQEPLRKLQIIASRIVDTEKQNLSNEGKDLLSRMNNSVKRMQNIIDDLLAYSTSDSEKTKFEKIDIVKIINDVKDDFSEEIKRKCATIEIESSCVVKVIPVQIRQVLYNLINNSFKFAKEGNPPQIQIQCQLIKGSSIQYKNFPPHKLFAHISYTDNGIGFEPKYSEKIFGLFQRLHAKDQYRGTGIGLAIVKKIIENHHGYVVASSEPGKGARFDIYLPQE
jgi:PAS domain S-box-containing protein